MDETTLLTWAGAFVSLIGVVMLIGVTRQRATERAAIATAARWPLVSGRVLDRGVEIRHHGRSTSCIPWVHYEYRVGGRDYRGERLRIGEPRYALDYFAQRAIDRYVPGLSVAVRVDPGDPASSVLELTGSRFVGAAQAAGVAALLAGLGIVVAAMLGLFKS